MSPVKLDAATRETIGKLHRSFAQAMAEGNVESADVLLQAMMRAWRERPPLPRVVDLDDERARKLLPHGRTSF